MDKDKVTKAATKFEKIHLKQTLMQRFTDMQHTVKILSDLEQEKWRSGSEGKVVVQKFSPRSIPMQGIKSVLINATENLNAEINQNY